MSDAQDIDFGLIDDEYWTKPFKSRVEIETNLLHSGREALAIGAPSTVAVQLRKSLPVLVLRTATLDNMARTSFRKQAVITGMDLSTNRLHAYMAIVTDALPSPPYEGPHLEGMGGEAMVIDARKQLDLPWRAGSTFLISLIIRDQVSNRVRVELKKGGYEDPAVIEYLRKRDAQPEALEVWPPAALPMTDPFAHNVVTIPDYRDRTDSPPIPSEPGITVVAKRVVEIGENPSCIVRGSFRLPTQPRYVVAQPAPHQAIVPITLLLTGSDTAFPYSFALKVPAYELAGGVATGYFTVDLCTLGRFIQIEETFFIYAFSGEIMSGPVPMAVVR